MLMLEEEEDLIGLQNKRFEYSPMYKGINDVYLTSLLRYTEKTKKEKEKRSPGTNKTKKQKTKNSLPYILVPNSGIILNNCGEQKF